MRYLTLSKRSLFLPVVALGAASFAFNLLTTKRADEGEDRPEIVEKKRLRIFRPRRTSSKISKYLLKILNNIDNNRLLFVEISAKNKRVRELVLKQLEALKTEEAVDDMWIADFYKQRYSRDDTIALVNKKAIFYLSNLEEVEKLRISARTTVAKLIGNSLSKLSTKYPSMERYFFEPMLDIYAPLKETEELTNFGIVKEHQLYRGGMPVGELSYDQLVELGVKTVINLKIEDSAVEYVSEQNNLLKRDINLHYLPLPNVAPPTMLQVMEFLTIAYNSDMTPVFIHCHRGADRTGVIAAIFRITQGHSASWAMFEAEKYNIASSFHTKKIDFVYEFEKQWLKWKEEGKLKEDLINFDFMHLMAQEEDISESLDTEEHIENELVDELKENPDPDIVNAEEKKTDEISNSPNF